MNPENRNTILRIDDEKISDMFNDRAPNIPIFVGKIVNIEIGCPEETDVFITISDGHVNQSTIEERTVFLDMLKITTMSRDDLLGMMVTVYVDGRMKWFEFGGHLNSFGIDAFGKPEETARELGYTYGHNVKSVLPSDFSMEDLPKVIKNFYKFRVSDIIDKHRRMFKEFPEKARFRAFFKGFEKAVNCRDDES